LEKEKRNCPFRHDRQKRIRAEKSGFDFTGEAVLTEGLGDGAGLRKAESSFIKVV
jgi:hypothetical protein